MAAVDGGVVEYALVPLLCLSVQRYAPSIDKQAQARQRVISVVVRHAYCGLGA